MPWVKLDDQFFAHPKVIDLSKDAKLLYLAGLTYCASQLTDGVISSGALRMIAGQVDVEREGAAHELVRAGLWSIDGANGYGVHDYLDYQPTAEQVRTARAQTAKRVADWRSRNVLRPLGNAVTNADVTPLVRVPRTPTPTPTDTLPPRPVPSPSASGAKVDLTVRSYARARETTPTATAPTPAAAPLPHLKQAESNTRKQKQKPIPVGIEPAVLDGLTEIFGTVATPAETQARYRWARQLTTADATKPEMHQRAKVYVHKWPNVAFTPKAFVEHWSELRSELNGKHPEPTESVADADARRAVEAQSLAREQSAMAAMVRAVRGDQEPA